MTITDDVREILDGITQQTYMLSLRSAQYSRAGDHATAAYCKEVRRQLWQVADEIAAHARSNGTLPGGGA